MSGREQTGRGWRTFWPLLLPVAAYELACFVLLITRGQYLYFMMGWNVFLALLPLVFVAIAGAGYFLGYHDTQLNALFRKNKK